MGYRVTSAARLKRVYPFDVSKESIWADFAAPFIDNSGWRLSRSVAFLDRHDGTPLDGKVKAGDRFIGPPFTFDIITWLPCEQYSFMESYIHNKSDIEIDRTTFDLKIEDAEGVAGFQVNITRREHGYTDSVFRRMIVMEKIKVNFGSNTKKLTDWKINLDLVRSLNFVRA